ncbi:hypothetical protein STEG23_021489, partial [Scotinomys teguina]
DQYISVYKVFTFIPLCVLDFVTLTQTRVTWKMKEPQLRKCLQKTGLWGLQPVNKGDCTSTTGTTGFNFNQKKCKCHLVCKPNKIFTSFLLTTLGFAYASLQGSDIDVYAGYSYVNLTYTLELSEKRENVFKRSSCKAFS